MVVKLVVCDDRESNDRFEVCCGASVYDMLAESLVGDDRRPWEAPTASERMNSYDEWAAYHFPRLKDEEADDTQRNQSRDYLAVIILGTTGWSGRARSDGRSWECKFEDLAEEGKVLYRQIEALYPGGTLHLLTFLDT